MLPPDAVLWDLDGTLVDTEPSWMAGERELAAAHGVRWDHEDALSIVGMALLDGAHVMRKAGVDMPEPEIVDFLVGRVVADLDGEVPWRPGALRMLTGLAAAGVPCALVTMSWQVIAERVVARAPDGAFRAVVTGDTVVHGKPHPEPYLTAAADLGVDITRCVAVEDSLTGLASATASGARVLAVPNVVPVGPAAGRSRIATLEDLSLDLVSRIAAGEVVDHLA